MQKHLELLTFEVTILLTKEERAIFEYELAKLVSEYRKCTNPYLESQIEEHIVLLQSTLYILNKNQEDF